MWHKQRVDIHQRQKEGIVAAKDRGVNMGRPKKEISDDFLMIKEEWE